MAVLVCGGAGYIGSHTVAELLSQGEEVVVVDNLITGHKNAVLNEAALCIGSIDDVLFMDSVFCSYPIDSVIHFAAYSQVGESVTDPLKYYENNVYGTLCLLKIMRKYGLNKIVFSSTAATYGEPNHTPILESDKTLPTNPYGDTKLAVEKMLKWSDNAYGIKHVILRYFNAAGAHITGKIGEDHSPESHLIPIILQVALGQRNKMYIFGEDYDTPDGSCVRDYIHVTDLAKAHILALNSLRSNGVSATYNLGNGKGFSVKEVIDIAQQVTGKPIQVKIAERRAGDPAALVASSEKIKQELGWDPQFGSLKQIIKTAWKWHQTHPKGYKDTLGSSS